MTNRSFYDSLISTIQTKTLITLGRLKVFSLLGVSPQAGSEPTENSDGNSNNGSKLLFLIYSRNVNMDL